MVLGQHRRMWLEAMRQTEQRVYGFGSLKDGYALVGIHLRKQKCCLKKGTTSQLSYETKSDRIVFKIIPRMIQSQTIIDYFLNIFVLFPFLN